AGVVGRTRRARATGLRLPQLLEQRRCPPHLGEATGAAHVAGQELVVDGERAGVDVADRVDQAHNAARTAQIQPGKRGRAQRVEVEERVAGQHVLTVAQQPLVQLSLLLLGRVQLVPDVRATSGRPQPGDAQLGIEVVGDAFELVELVDVVPGHHHADLEAGESGLGEVLHGTPRGVARSVTAHRVVDLGRGAVQRHLDVHVVHGGQLPCALLADAHAVGGELHPDLVVDGVFQQLPEVRAHGRFTAADVDVEDLHALQLVDDAFA